MISQLIQVFRLRKHWPDCRIPIGIHPRIDSFDAVRLGRRVQFGLAGEIVVHASSPLSHTQGLLQIGDDSYIGSYFNIRAAGGSVVLGNRVQIAQHVSIIAANHTLARAGGKDSLDESKTGILIMDDVWIGCNSVVLPGVTIGAGAVIGAGSVVTRTVPSFELWAGNPARFLRKI